MGMAMKKFLRDESGLETVEWAVIISIIVLAAMAAFTPLGGWIRMKITSVMH